MAREVVWPQGGQGLPDQSTAAWLPLGQSKQRRLPWCSPQGGVLMTAVPASFLVSGVVLGPGRPAWKEPSHHVDAGNGGVGAPMILQAPASKSPCALWQPQRESTAA